MISITILHYINLHPSCLSCFVLKPYNVRRLGSTIGCNLDSTQSLQWKKHPKCEDDIMFALWQSNLAKHIQETKEKREPEKGASPNMTNN